MSPISTASSAPSIPLVGRVFVLQHGVGPEPRTDQIHSLNLPIRHVTVRSLLHHVPPIFVKSYPIAQSEPVLHWLDFGGQENERISISEPGAEKIGGQVVGSGFAESGRDERSKLHRVVEA